MKYAMTLLHPADTYVMISRTVMRVEVMRIFVLKGEKHVEVVMFPQCKQGLKEKHNKDNYTS